MVNSNASFDERVMAVIPSVFNMISSSEDHQQSEEAYNTKTFELPNPAGKAGGAATSAFLQQQYDGGASALGAVTWVQTLQQMKRVLHGMGYNQTPTLTSSRIINVRSDPMRIVPPGSGRRRALCIGINYVGQKGQLTACHNDCSNVVEYLMNVQGFRQDEILVLMDDGNHEMPTKRNILNGMILLTKYSQPGDVAFVSFSGHGGNVEDLDGDEDDGMDETLIPVDYVTEGHIVDDDST
jgi:metacaspase-1